MRFTYNTKHLGTLEMTNFKAKLRQRHLGFGGSTKAKDDKQLGQHGEGLKLSALFNCRHPHNYSFAVFSSSCKWTFGWNVDMKLNCVIGAKARVWEDVSLVIGEPRKLNTLTRDIMSSKVPLSTFDTWLKMALDIQPRKNIIQTPYGDLILHSDHQNKLYLHAFLLPNGSKSGKTFTYGYNLLNMRTGRDRDTTADTSMEGREISLIWTTALREDQNAVFSQGLLSKCYTLLQDSFYDAADVYCVADFLDRSTAKLIWEHMLKTDLDKNGRSPFYYNPNSDQEVSGHKHLRAFQY